MHRDHDVPTAPALPPMHAVSSANIAAIGFTPVGGEVFVRFHTGAVWKYWPCTQGEFDAFVAAPSVGRYFAAHIKTRSGEQVEAA